ncbi:ester cyclase [Natrononativus amylolyticus]|uniref:ester cyclase n=1 Tax=Natrononativus amylolyticus TaxID=2963434 RepID=UPI0020CFBF89|nr:ester cyclase [Natrononativus amylolyticus]
MPNADTPVEALHRLYDGVWNGDDLAVADELVHPEYYIHDREIAEETRGPELYKTLAEMTRAIFPDMAFTVHETISEGNMVALRWTMTGTHEGPMFGVEPTGTAVELSAIEINRFGDGKLVETWTQSDMLGLMEQIGAVPSSGEPTRE